MGSTKFVVVNYHLANIWDSTFEVFVAHMIEAAAAMSVDLSDWEIFAFLPGDSLQFTFNDNPHLENAKMLAILDATKGRIVAMGDVGPEDVATWSIGVNNKKVSGGQLRGDMVIEVEHLLEVAEWFESAVRNDPNREYGAELGRPRRQKPDQQQSIVNLLAYLCAHYPYRSELCATRTMKLVYLADQEMTKRHGRTITEIRWRSNPGGPWSLDVLDAAAERPDFDIATFADGFGGTKEVISLANGRLVSQLSKAEQESVAAVIETTQFMNFDQFIAQRLASGKWSRFGHGHRTNSGTGWNTGVLVRTVACVYGALAGNRTTAA